VAPSFLSRFEKKVNEENMTGDRRLTAQEMIAFKLEKEDRRFDALETIKRAILERGDEPTLFELAIIELAAAIESHKNIIIDLGRQIRRLDERLAPQERVKKA